MSHLRQPNAWTMLHLLSLLALACVLAQALAAGTIQKEGIQTANILTDTLRFETVQDYEDWLARLEAFPSYMDQTIALLKKGIKDKIVHARVVMERVPAQIAQQIVKDPEKSLFYKPF